MADYDNSAAIDALRSRIGRIAKWRLSFLLSMPLGFIIPCGLALGAGSKGGQPAPEGVTLPQVFGMAALALPAIGFVGWFLMRSDKGRYAHSLAVAEQADELGLRFDEGPADRLLEFLEACPGFGGADHYFGRDCCTGRVGGRKVAILEFSTGYRGGRSAADVEVHAQTVVVVYGPDRDTPDFRVGPKGWMAKVAKLVGDEAIRLPGKSKFNDDFAVYGEDVGAVKALLSTPVIDSIRRANATVEVHGGDLVFYRHDEIAEPADYADLVREAVEVAKTLRAAK